MKPYMLVSQVHVPSMFTVGAQPKKTVQAITRKPEPVFITGLQSGTSDKGSSTKGTASQQWTHYQIKLMVVVFLATERGKPLYIATKDEPPMCLLFRGSTVDHEYVSSRLRT